MDPIENAIRGALAKGNIEDAAFRRRIYASAEQALIRSLVAKGGKSPAEQQARVKHLRAMADKIETEFEPATPAVQAPQRPLPFPSRRAEPNLAPRPGHHEDTPAERKSRAKLFNRLVGLFVFVTLFALVVMLGWAIWNSGLMNTKERQDQAAQASGQEATGDSADDVRNWITVFQPSDISSVDVSEGLTAELQGEGKNAYLRLVSAKGAKDAQATFEIGRGVLETLQGKKVVFDVRGHTSDGSEAEVAVTCELAGMGICQRTRFRLEGQTSDNLLIVQLGDVAPEASGSLVLIPDLNGSGNPVDIQSIRVRVEP